MHLQVRPGDYVIPRMPLVLLWASEGFCDDAAVRKNFELRRQRTPYQGAEFAFSQLVELAVRALSPGINDRSRPSCVSIVSRQLCAFLRTVICPHPTGSIGEIICV